LILNHRPGAGSYTPNWGTTGDRDLRDFFGGLTSRVALRRLPDPTQAWIGPRPGDRCWTCDLCGAIAHPMRPDGRVSY
jgi:hypothetical protein